MELNPIAMLRNSARRLVVVRSVELDVQMVYAIQRIGAPVFLRLAMSAHATASIRQRDEEERQSRMLGVRTDEDRARVEAELEEGKAIREQKFADELVTGGKLEELINLQDELVTTATVAVGIARDDIEVRDGMQPIDTRPEDICQPLDEDSAKSPKGKQDRVYLRPIRWAAPGQADADHLQIAHIPEEERALLARLIAEAFGPGREVTTFRDGQGRDAGVREVGRDVRPKTKRSRAGKSGRSADRHGRDGGR